MADYTFNVKLRGYDKNEVDNYIEKLQKEFAEVCAHLQGKVESLETSLCDQDDIAKAMIQAQTLVRQAEEEAKLESDKIIKKSQTEAAQILGNAKINANKILYDTQSQAAEILNTAEANANNITLIAEAKADRVMKQINNNRDEIREEMKKIFNISSLFLKEIDSDETPDDETKDINVLDNSGNDTAIEFTIDENDYGKFKVIEFANTLNY